MRLGLYQLFLSAVHGLYLEAHPELKNEDGSVKLEALFGLNQLRLESPNLASPSAPLFPETLPKKYPHPNLRSRGPSTRNVEA